ncbi:MAG TPA: tRNA-dihydrouridine synthase family protein [Prolixibacteraceae bacterium]|jgi:tRNA-dihydrouridine synthase
MQKESDIKIYFAPLQESTDYIYRGAHAKFFGGVDKYFAPYIVRQNDGTVKTSHLRDIKSENNQGYPLVPQILAGNSTDFIFLAKMLQDNGYNEINWNLGCPYPMVTNKGLGAGLLPFPDRIKSILEESLPQVSCKVSVKMRTGLQSHNEIFQIIDVLNEFPLSEIILHPRFGKQLYRGEPDEETFINVHKTLNHSLIYNGDIESAENLSRLNILFGDNTTWMIGRGILKNPFFPLILKNGTVPEIDEKTIILRNFHNEIFLKYSNLLSGSSHILMRMEKFWSYFSFVFPDAHKTFKRIKKASNIVKYEAAVNENFQRLRNHEEDERSPNS